MYLQVEIDDLIFAEAAHRIHLDRCEEVPHKAVGHMINLFYCCYDEMPKIHRLYCGKDLSEEIKELIQAVCRSVDILKYLDGLKRQAQPPKSKTRV